MTAEVLMAIPCTKSRGCESGGHKHGGDEGHRLCWKCRTAVDIDVGPERRSHRYHETCLALEGVEESSAAVSKPRSVVGDVHRSTLGNAGA